MDDEQDLLNEQEPPPDAAAEAFARLEACIAGIEDRIERRMAILTRAVEHVAIEKQDIEIPDYGSTLASMGEVLARLAGEVGKLADAPALKLTPQGMAEQMRQAANQARETDEATIKTSQQLHRQTHADLTSAIGAVRNKEQQRWRLLQAIGGTALVLSLLWLIYPGWAAGIGPQGWLWPERVARRTLGEPSLWEAGIRLMRAGDPQAWQAIVAAAQMRQGNRETIAACEKAAAKAKEPVNCTVAVGAETG